MKYLITISGFSGSGKDTMLTALRNCTDVLGGLGGLGGLRVSDIMTFITPYTDRPQRESEQEGDPYHFISKDKMKEFIQDDKCLEYYKYNTVFNNRKDEWTYCTLNSQLKDVNIYQLGVEATLNLIDSQRTSKTLTVIPLFINAPDEIREERAKKRGTFCQLEWDRRLKVDVELKSQLDKFIVIDTVDELKNIIEPFKHIVNTVNTVNTVKY